MRELIAAAYPEHGILGEEHGRERVDAEFVWVLDPIDGTKSFITGRPLFGTLIALAHRGRPVLGLIDQSILRERWVGVAGGAVRLERPADPGAALPAARGCGAVRDQPGDVPGRRRRPTASIVSSAGSVCRCTAATATPTACWPWASPIWSSRPASQPYDFMALVPVIEGAGGRITDWQGRALTLGSSGQVVATGDARVHAAACELLG